MYIEPFLGGGALFFALRPRKAVLADINGDLINFYHVLRDDPEKLIKGLTCHPNQKRVYYRIRSSTPTSHVGRAVRFLYLNRTCFNGLFRTNAAGIFNVPYGDRSRSVLGNVETLRASGLSLKGVKLVCQDFDLTCARAKPGDFVFLDPPYTVMHYKNAFIKYNPRLFTWEDQIRLRDTFACLSKKKVHLLLTNAAHSEVLRLYSDFNVRTIKRKSLLSATRDSRRDIHEAIISNY